MRIKQDAPAQNSSAPKKYKMAVMIFEAEEEINSNENPTISHENPTISHEKYIEEYKNQMKVNILLKIQKKLSEISDSKNSPKEVQENIIPPPKSDFTSAENQTDKKAGDDMSSDDYDENEKAEEKQIVTETPKRGLSHYLNMWKGFSKYGEPIENTFIIPSKTFFMSKQAEILKETPYYYSIIDCLKEHSQRGINIKKIIDINFSQMYYNFNKLKKYYKNELFGIEFLKIPLVPKEIPSRKELNRIYDILNKNISKKEYILIHCTNGVNRTGYVLVYFLCKRYEYTVDKAVALFEKCRGHCFTNKAFVEDLRQKFKDNQ